MSINRALFITAILTFACISGITAVGQRLESYRAFTLTSEVSDYDASGNRLPAFKETRYFSASGDWRYRAEYPGGSIVETIYRHGRGVYFADHKNGQILKVSEFYAGQPKSTTAELLRTDPKFIRIEQVLGLLAYVHQKRIAGYVMETYFAPELGSIPLKRVSNFSDGYKRIEEPVSITWGEPESSQVKGADYLIVEEKPVFDDKISDRIQMKPAPIYSQEAKALRISGTVTLQIIVDERGDVVSARVVSIPLPFLDEAAMKAAYQAHFTPAEARDKQVKVTGLIRYEFVPSKAQGCCTNKEG
jgi:TonB family protein